MRTIAQVAQPGFERWRIVCPHDFTVRYHGRLAAHRGPLARAIEEGDVDVWVRIQVVGLSAFGVGVEEQVDPTVFLENALVSSFGKLTGKRGKGFQVGRYRELGSLNLSGHGHTPRGEETGAISPCGQHAELGCGYEVDETVDFLFQRRFVQVLRFVRIGRLIAGVCITKGHFGLRSERKGSAWWAPRSDPRGIGSY